MKRKFALLLATSLLLTTLVSCGSGSSTAPAGDSTPTDGGTTDGGTTTAGEGGNITVWADPSMYLWFEEMATKWNAETGNTVDLVSMSMVDGDYAHALDGPAGIGPDLMGGPHNDVGDKSSQGMYAAINLAPDSLAAINVPAVEACTFEDSLYVVPLYMGTNLLIYNKDLVPTPPDTWDEFISIIDDPTFDNGGDGSLGFLGNLGDFYNSAGFIWAGGGYMYGNGNTDVSSIGLNNEGAVFGAECVQELFSKMPQGMGDRTSANDLMVGLFNENKVGMILRGTDVIPSIESAGINYGLARMPKLPNGEVIANYSGFTGVAMSGFAPNPELATEFLNFIVLDENSATFSDATGLITTNQAYLDENSATSEVIKAFNEQIGYCVPMAKIVEGNLTWDPMHVAMGSLATGADPQEALDIAVQQVQDSIDALHAG